MLSLQCLSAWSPVGTTNMIANTTTSIQSSMPFGVESCWDSRKHQTTVCAGIAVFNAFRRGVLLGPRVAAQSPIRCAQSSMPFGVESCWDTVNQSGNTYQNNVFNAFRRGVLLGRQGRCNQRTCQAGLQCLSAWSPVGTIEEDELHFDWRGLQCLSAWSPVGTTVEAAKEFASFQGLQCLSAWSPVGTRHQSKAPSQRRSLQCLSAWSPVGTKK